MGRKIDRPQAMPSRARRTGTAEIRAWLGADNDNATAKRMSVRTNEIQAWKSYRGLTTPARKFDHAPEDEEGHDRRTIRGGVNFVVPDEEKRRKSRMTTVWKVGLSEGGEKPAEERKDRRTEFVKKYVDDTVDEPDEGRRRRRATVLRNYLKDVILDGVLEDAQPDEENQLMVDLPPSLDESFDLPRDILGVYFDSRQGSGAFAYQWESSDGATIASSILSLLSSLEGTMWWVPGFIDDLPDPYDRALSHLDWVLRGFGQIFFCNNTLSGFIILVAICVQSPRVAAHAFAAVLAANVSAGILGFEEGIIASGLFGYNAGLIGIAIASLLPGDYSLPVFLAVALLSVLSVVVFVAVSKVLLTYITPPMTLPFDFLLTTMFLASASMDNLILGRSLNPTGDGEDDETDLEVNLHTFLLITCRGVGQIVFAPDMAPCVLILVGVAICSRRIAAYAFIGSAMGSAFALFAGVAREDINLGLYGYCPALTFVATGFFFVPSIGAHLLAAVGVFGTTILQAALTTQLGSIGLPVCSFPFSIVSICIVLTQGDTKRVLAVPLESVTFPEDHIRRVQVLRSGFALFLAAIHSHGEEKRNTCFSDGVIPKNRRESLTKNASEIMKSYATFYGDSDGISDGLIHEKEHIMRRCDQCAHQMFRMIDKGGDGYISKEDFEEYLTKIGLSDADGKDIAGEALSLFVHKNDAIELDEWKSFCRCSVALGEVHELLANFFNFVDFDMDGFVQSDGLSHALTYLGRPHLTKGERKVISRISLDPNEFNVDDMIMFVGAEMLKKLARYEKKAREANHTSRTSTGSLRLGFDANLLMGSFDFEKGQVPDST